MNNQASQEGMKKVNHFVIPTVTAATPNNAIAIPAKMSAKVRSRRLV